MERLRFLKDSSEIRVNGLWKLMMDYGVKNGSGVGVVFGEFGNREVG